MERKEAKEVELGNATKSNHNAALPDYMVKEASM